MSKGITFFKEDREPTPDNPNEIINDIVDDEVANYINRLEKYKNNWGELKNYTNNVIKKHEKYDNENNCEWQGYNFTFDILNKMKELEEGK